MKIDRVEEIINSKGVIEVTYKESPVWIESVAKDNATALVQLLPYSLALNIPVEDLTEKSPRGSYH